LTAAIRAQASVIQTDDPLEIKSADKRHVVAIQNWNCLQRPMWRPTRHTPLRARGATLARFSPPKDIPILIANSRGPETLDELAPGSAHASRLCRLSVLLARFRAE
jgi:hypothetical protein